MIFVLGRFSALFSCAFEGDGKMAQPKPQNDFSKGKMWRNILNQAIPLTVAQTVQVLYNVVDRIYLGHLPGSSSLALTGVGLIFPEQHDRQFDQGGGPIQRRGLRIDQTMNMLQHAHIVRALFVKIKRKAGRCFAVRHFLALRLIR